MSTLLSQVVQQMGLTELPTDLTKPGLELASLIEADAYVGEVFSIGYDEALVQIHDYNRQQVGGIPALSFLLATRIPPEVFQTSERRTRRLFCFGSWIMPTWQMLKKLFVCGSKTLSV